MGYYDEHQTNETKRRGGKAGYFFASIAGVVIGALLVAFLLPQLGYLNNQSTNGTSLVPEQGTGKNQTLSVSVDTRVTEAVKKVGNAVVGISNIQSGDLFSGQQDQKQQEVGSGSGVVYKKEGNKAFVVTNNHVIEGAEKLEVTMPDGSKLPAKIKGSDIWTDLAVLEVDGTTIKTIASFGNSDALKAGEPVIAIGNPLGKEFSGSVTQGIVSGLQRTIPVDLNQDGQEDWQTEVIQTDAAINPGNSGGALINLAGQVIGINSMKIAEQAVEGIGLAIPANSAKPIIDSLEKNGTVKRAAMGVTLRNLAEISAYHQQESLNLPKNIKGGIMIDRVLANSPASKAGLKEMDVIIQLDDQKVNNMIELRKYLYSKKSIGDSMRVKYYRNGKIEETTMKLTDEAQL
jgi:serine protease Do